VGAAAALPAAARPAAALPAAASTVTLTLADGSGRTGDPRAAAVDAPLPDTLAG
jgi:hypothetical protein